MVELWNVGDGGIDPAPPTTDSELSKTYCAKSLFSIYFTVILTRYIEFAVAIATKNCENDPVPYDIE
jgi:hypothetical protein